MVGCLECVEEDQGKPHLQNVLDCYATPQPECAKTPLTCDASAPAPAGGAEGNVTQETSGHPGALYGLSTTALCLLLFMAAALA
jgi:hypothetical protein